MNIIDVEKYDNYFKQFDCPLRYPSTTFKDFIFNLEVEEFKTILNENKYKEFLKRAILFGRRGFIIAIINSKIREYDKILLNNENLIFKDYLLLFDIYKEIIKSKPIVSTNIAEAYYIISKECNNFYRHTGLPQQQDHILKSIIHDIRSI